MTTKRLSCYATTFSGSIPEQFSSSDAEYCLSHASRHLHSTQHHLLIASRNHIITAQIPPPPVFLTLSGGATLVAASRLTTAT